MSGIWGFEVIFNFLTKMNWSCGGGHDNAPILPEESDNNAPGAPIPADPANNVLRTDNSLVFNWGAVTDKDGDTVSYALEISEDNAFSDIIYDSELFVKPRKVLLEKWTVYYWWGVAKGYKEGVAVGQI